MYKCGNGKSREGNSVGRDYASLKNGTQIFMMVMIKWIFIYYSMRNHNSS
jgi:hypothetical protein